MGTGGDLDEAIDVSLWEGEHDTQDNDEKLDAGSVQGEDGADEAEGASAEAGEDGVETNGDEQLGSSSEDLQEQQHADQAEAEKNGSEVD